MTELSTQLRTLVLGLPVSPLRRPRVHDTVTRLIGERIVNGEYPPGETLPNEASFCDELEISRSAIREALRVLATKGLIEAKARVGTVVLPPDRWNMLDEDILEWTRHGTALDRLISSLIEARMLIEPEAAALAAKRARSADLLSIEQALDDMANTEHDRDAHLEADYAFHAAVISASGNIIFAQFLGVIRRVLIESFRRSSSGLKQREAAQELHTDVFDAIRARDEIAARAAMAKLLGDAKTKLLKSKRTLK